MQTPTRLSGPDGRFISAAVAAAAGAATARLPVLLHRHSHPLLQVDA